jgi:hypothetical protein
MSFIRIILVLFFSSCSLVGSNIKSIDTSDDFFLCFPETDLEFSKLDFEERLLIQRKISLERMERELTCEDYSNYASGEESLKKINQEELDKKTGKCRYRGEPCHYD